MPSKQNDLEPLLNAQQNHLAMVMSESSSTDAKALSIAAANITVLIFIAQAGLSFSSWWLQALLLAPYVTALLFSTLAILPQRYIGAGINIDSLPEYLKMDRDMLVLQLLSNTQIGIKTNDRLNRMRWRYCAISLIFMAIGTIVLFVIL